MSKPRAAPQSESDRVRTATVYDAVAGRIGVDGFIHEPRPTKNRDTTNTSTAQVPPDEVLFRRKRAPVRFEEHDFYEADRELSPGQKLPESDLLKSVHEYVSHFYHRSSLERGRHDFESFDETALLAMGILLEEAAAEVLGNTGDLALVENDRGADDMVGSQNTYWHNGRRTRRVIQHFPAVRSVGSKSKPQPLQRLSE